ncbi:MAG: AAA family ATPase [Leptolyngbyaceae cyanobacterium bins.349]|nr:AAA family ATPase [Leptolyngbyaceae cyanobacterium bins.349]
MKASIASFVSESIKVECLQNHSFGVAIKLMQANFQSCGQRISIVGTTGSGKTTLARQVAQHFQIPHIELDALNWEPNWTAALPQVFRKRVSKALNSDRWVVDGNYSGVRDIVWSRADTVVFLDYSFWLIMRQLLRQTLQRSLKQEELWNGNREDIRKSFLSQESIVLWMLQTYQRNRKKYPLLFQRPEYTHLSVVHLQSPEMAEWLLRF